MLLYDGEVGFGVRALRFDFLSGNYLLSSHIHVRPTVFFCHFIITYK